MAEPRTGYRQVLDIRAAVIASIVAGLAFLGTMMFFDAQYLNAPWFTVRMGATLFMGDAAMEPPLGYHTSFVLVGLLTHLLLALVLGFIIAGVLHRFGLVVGILGGAFLGFCFYFINYYSLAEWLDLRSMLSYKRWTLEVAHVVFGAIAGGVYELLERARYERR